MAKIDIRNLEQEIDQIDFGGESVGTVFGFTVCKGDLSIDICDPSRFISIRKSEVKNLIKALQKAVELGWTK